MPWAGFELAIYIRELWRRVGPYVCTCMLTHTRDHLSLNLEQLTVLLVMKLAAVSTVNGLPYSAAPLSFCSYRQTNQKVTGLA